ncbi:MAG TPA: threonine synthase [Actinomycetota bacterium]|nr:threonine synthase [Actinomycetota bacterium]
MTSFVTGLTCSECGRTYDHREAQGTCVEDGRPLLVEYDLGGIRRTVRRDDLAARIPTMWRYRELLPVEEDENIVSLGEGFTPMLLSDTVASLLGVAQVWIKDEGRNPTGTFKARGASCGVSRAMDLGISDVALPTAGNAGGAWACYGAAVGLGVHVAVPSEAPAITAIECRAHGADVIEVEGAIDAASRHLDGRIAEERWFDVSGYREPYRLDGKRTLGFEIAEQLGWRRPDAIVYPTGGALALLGIWRAWVQLIELGWVEPPLPRLIAVQSTGCAPVVRAFESRAEDTEPFEGAGTVASGLLVPASIGHKLALRAIRHSGGTAIAVPDEAIIDAVATMAREGAVLASPEAAATLAGAVALRERGDLAPEDRVVLVATGSGHKYPEVVERAAGPGG